MVAKTTFPVFVAAAAATLVALGCHDAKSSGDATTPGVHPKLAALEAFFGPDVLQTIQDADVLLVHRLARPEDETDISPRPLSEIKLLTAPVLATPEQRDELRRLLLDPKGYVWEVEKDCNDFPTVRLEFSRGKRTADVLIQGYCWYVCVYEGGRFVRREDFDHNWPRVLEVLKKMFPQDPELSGMQ